ncbi:MAG: hypothetical protein ABI273_13175 [Lacunisphaera sp.]
MVFFKSHLKLIGLLIGLLLLVRVAAADADHPLAYDSLDLTDGRKLVQVVIKNYDPASNKVLLVTNRTAMRLPLDLFPATLRDRIKEAAPKAGGSTTITASVPSPLPGENREVPAVSARPVHAAVNVAAHKKAALTRAQDYYRFEFPAGSGAVRVTAANFELDEPEEVPGWGGRYRTEGKVFLEFFDSKGFSYSRTTDRFEIQTEQKPGGSIKVIDFTRK